MNNINQKLEEKIKNFYEIDKNTSNNSEDNNLENTDVLSHIKKTKEIKNDNNVVYNNIYSNFESNDKDSIYYTGNYFSIINYMKGLDQKVNDKINNSSKNNTSNNIYYQSKNNCNNSFFTEKDNKAEDIKKTYKRNVSAPKFSHQIKNIEKDPKKFVEALFYNKKIKEKEKKITQNFIKETFRKKEKENINNSNFTFRPKINKKSQEIANKLGPSFSRLFQNKNIINHENMEKMTIDCYKNLYKKVPYKFQNKDIKEKGNNSKIQKLINKLYNGGIKDLQKKELIYKENLIKKSEEYKNHPYQPNKSKSNKNNNNNSLNNTKMSLEDLNNDMYSKQIEWKNKKNEFNKNRKQFEEELFLSKNCPFKPDISHKYIKDDEKTIKRNFSNMNNYIIKRRKQIIIKKEKENKILLRNYSSCYNKEKKSNSNLTCFNFKSNSNQYFIRNSQNYYNYPRTDRTYYNNENVELNSSFMYNNNKKVNCSQKYFVEVVNALHNEIYNLNI